MRVIAGKYRGRKLISPSGDKTRPILDRVKASVFDWLGSRLAQPGSLPAIDVLDLFCGGGSQGIEALSRGAASCTFVETDRQALRCLRTNLDQMRIGREAVIIDRPAQSLDLSRPAGPGFGLVFVDPPYVLSEDTSAGSVMGRLFAALGTRIATAPDVLVLWRHPIEIELPSRLGDLWAVSEIRRWGSMAVTLFELTASQAS